MMNASRKVPIYIALGTNLWDRAANLQTALCLLPPLVEVLAQSTVYQTPPWGFEDQPDFLNQVLLAETSCSPLDLLAHLKQTETRVGRKPTFRYGPRMVDLDILFYGDQILDLPGLQIPHPKLPERAFVLVPLADLNPDFVHPVIKKSIREILSQVDASGITRYQP
jgi:2-amino-4-hydroxy-6-hydroxymethyldihydropteridine diphosphokinase